MMHMPMVWCLCDAATNVAVAATLWQVNYALIVLAAVSVSLLLNPLSFFVLSLLGAIWVYLLAIRTEPLVRIQLNMADQRNLLLLRH